MTWRLLIAVLFVVSAPATTTAGEPEDLVARAIEEFADAQAGPEQALTGAVAAWATLQQVVISFPRSPTAAAVLAADPALGIDRHAVEQAVVEGLASQIIALGSAPIDGLINLGDEDAVALVQALVRNGQFDLAQQVAGLKWQYEAGNWLARYFASIGERTRAKQSIGGGIASQDAIVRGLLASLGAAAAMPDFDLIDYRSLERGGLTLKLDTLLAIGATPATTPADVAAAGDAMARARDLAVGLGTDCEAARALGRAGLLTLALRRSGLRNNRELRPQDGPCLRDMVAILTARGEDSWARQLIKDTRLGPDVAGAFYLQLAAAQRLRQDDTAALATVAMATADAQPAQRATLLAQLGFVDAAIEAIGDDTDTAAWRTIAMAETVRSGAAAAWRVLALHGVGTDAAITRGIALAAVEAEPAAALGLAEDDPDLAIDVARALAARSNFAQALAALKSAEAHQLDSQQTGAIADLRFELGLASGDLALAELNQPSFGEHDTAVARLIDAALRTGQVDEAVRIAASYKDNYYWNGLKYGWAWQIATFLAASREPDDIADYISQGLDVDLRGNTLNWAKLLLQTGHWTEALKVADGVEGYDASLTKARIYIAFLARI